MVRQGRGVGGERAGQKVRANVNHRELFLTFTQKPPNLVTYPHNVLENKVMDFFVNGII